jgi:hypothetical protein
LTSGISISEPVDFGHFHIRDDNVQHVFAQDVEGHSPVGDMSHLMRSLFQEHANFHRLGGAIFD